jgi:hypothetical protein
VRISKHYVTLLTLLIFLSSIVIHSSSATSKIDNPHWHSTAVDFSEYRDNSIKYGNNTFVEADDNKIHNFQSNISESDEFTLFVYIVGSNLEDNSYEATKDINEMLKGRLDNHKVNVVLQTGGAEGKPDGTRIIDFSSVKRHFISNNTIHTLPQDRGLVNMGDNKTLSDFLNWGISNFPANKYGLIFWGHGRGVQGFGVDKDNLGTDSLTLDEIIYSLSDTLVHYPSVNFKNFEFIGFDSCLMGTFEVASLLNFVLSNYKLSNFLIGSEEVEPNWGWNYTEIINSIALNPEITGDILGKRIIDSYVNDTNRISQENKFYANRDITLSVINTTRIPELNQRLDDIVNSTLQELRDQESLLKLLRTIDVTESFGETVTSSYGMIDLYDFLSNLADAFPSLETKINDVKEEINSVVVYNYSGEAHPNANGLSIFLPFSLSDLAIMNDMITKLSRISFNLNWLNFISQLGGIITTDKFSPVIQSSRNGDAIDVHISDPDIQTIFISYIIQSTKGTPILYIQNLDPNLINETGFFQYEDKGMLALCNEQLCSPVSMTMNINKDTQRIFIPVEIQSSKPPNRQVSLVYELQNNSFFFLGGIDETQVRGGQSIPKEKVIFEQGDIITPRGLKYTGQPFFIEEPTTIKNRIKSIFSNTFERDISLSVADPIKIMPKFVNINQTAISMAFCDFSDHCDQTRTYYVSTSNDTNYPFELADQSQELLFNYTGTNNSNNLIYANQKHGFQLEHPSNWISVDIDPYAPTQSQIYLNDPNVLLLFPLDEIINSNGSAFSLQNRISIAMHEGANTNPKLYFDFLNNTRTRQNAQLEYELSNASKTSINGYSAYEFILKYEKMLPFSNEKDAKRFEYIVTLLIDRKEYTISFASEEAIFYKYLPIVKTIISSFRPINEPESQESPTESNDENKGIVKIREIMTDRMLKNTIWEEYIDPVYNFTLSYPYIDKLNKPQSQQLGNNNTRLILFIPPGDTFLDHPHKDPSLSIAISNDSVFIESLQAKKQLFNYEFLNSTMENLLDGSLTMVSEQKYFLPLVYQWVYEKEAYAYVDDKLVWISIIAPYDDRIRYESVFDNIIKSFEFLNKR